MVDKLNLFKNNFHVYDIPRHYIIRMISEYIIPLKIRIK